MFIYKVKSLVYYYYVTEAKRINKSGHIRQSRIAGSKEIDFCFEFQAWILVNLFQLSSLLQQGFILYQSDNSNIG